MQPVVILERDEISPWIKLVAENNPSWCRSALKSTGWMVQKEVKAGIRSKSPGGKPYVKGMPPKTRRLLDAGQGRRTFRTYRPLGKLLQAVGYDKSGVKQDGSGSIKVGWLSASAVKLGTIQEEGKSLAVTTKMRRYFWALGVKLKQSTKEIKIPARPTFEPMQQKLEPVIPKYFEQKIYEYWEGNDFRSSPASKRTYQVKGGVFGWAPSIK